MSEEINKLITDKQLDLNDADQNESSTIVVPAVPLSNNETCDKEKTYIVAEKESLSLPIYDKDENSSDTATDYSLTKMPKVSSVVDVAAETSLKDVVPNIVNTLPAAPPQPPPMLLSNKQPGQTKVISLDTIIRKGLSEQMPMTAKDINNIVPNAIKNQMPSSSNAVKIQQQMKQVPISLPIKPLENTAVIDVLPEKPATQTNSDSLTISNVSKTKLIRPSDNIETPVTDVPTTTTTTEIPSSPPPPAKQVNDNDELAVEEENDDDYDDDYDEDNDDLIIEAKLREKAEQEARKSKNEKRVNISGGNYLTDDGTSLKRKSLDLHDEDFVEDDDVLPQTDDNNERKNKKDVQLTEQLLEPMAEIPFDGGNLQTAKTASKKSTNDPKDSIELYDDDDDDEEAYTSGVGVDGTEGTGAVANDDQHSWHSYSDVESSESETMRKKRRRKSATNKDDDDDYLPTGNKKKKKMNSGPKRKPGRPKRDDIGLSTSTTPVGYYNQRNAFQQQQQSQNILEPTPMDELISMGHSVFAEYNPTAAASASATTSTSTTPSKRGGRRRKDNFEEFFKDTSEPHDLRLVTNTEQQISPSKCTPTTGTDAVTTAATGSTLTIEEKIAMGITAPAADHLQLFRRKPGRPKIDKESGGHIVFQNSEVTLVNKVVSIKPRTTVDIHEQSHTTTTTTTASQDNFDEQQQQLQQQQQQQQQKLPKRMSGIEIVPITNRKSAQEYHDTAGLLMGQSIDDMLEVHHIEDYKEYDAEIKRRGGRGNNKQQTKQDLAYSRSGNGSGGKGMYSDYDGIMTIIPSTSTAGNLQGRHRPIVETVKVEVHSSETQEISPTTNVSTTSTNNSDNGIAPTITNVVGKIRARRTSQLTEITKDVSAITTHTEQRFKRITKATKPKYYEWSENSNDNTDNNVTTTAAAAASTTSTTITGTLTNSNTGTQKQRKPHWRTLQKQRVANRQKGIHWKTQQRLLNQERMKASLDDSISDNVTTSAENVTMTQESGENDSETLLIKTNELSQQKEKLNDNKKSTNDESTENTITTNADGSSAGIINEFTSIDDDLTTKRKRIPKLKFGSYNFNERRDGSKPKMVLKYKKKYKKKPKKIIEQPLMLFAEGQQVEMLEPLADDNELQAPDEVIHGQYLNQSEMIAAKLQDYSQQLHQQPIRKRPGPKPGWKLASSISTPHTPHTPILASGRKKPGPKPKDKTTPTLATTSSSSLSKEFLKIPKRLSTSAASMHDEDTESTITGESTKRKRKVIIDEDGSSVSSLGSLTPNEIHEKLSKRYRSESLASECTDDIVKRYQVVKDRYKVLLDILEQRYSEIRDLKQRINQLEKRDHDDVQMITATTTSSSSSTTTTATATNSTSIELVKKEEIDSGSWSNAELSKAYSLQKLSRPFYRYVQERMLLPLPTIEVIEKYVDSIHMIRGLLPNMLQILEYDSETMTDIDRITVLQITQIKTATIYEYDKAMDKILGPHTQMTVVVARGLYSNWSQAVYINFDVTTFKPCLNMIIEELHKIKYPVVACVCNYHENDTNIWTELGVTMGCNYFAHPITTEFIYAFYYVDDLFAELRKQFCENGFTGDSGKISATPLKMLLNDNSNTKLRLSLKMIESSSTDKNPLTQTASIYYAKEIFTHETANLIKLYQPNNVEALSCSNFIEIICSFGAIMSSKNSLSINESINMMNIDQQNIEFLPYGTSLELQNQVLSEIQLNFYRLRCPGIAKMSNIQRAIMMMIESLKMLQHSTKQKYKIDGIPTAHITSDDFRGKLNAVKQRHKIYDEVIAPLQGFAFIKEIFLQCNAGKLHSYTNIIDDLTATTTTTTRTTPPLSQSTSINTENNDNYRLFYDEPIDISQPESYYVKHLLVWLIEQHKIKHPHSVVNDEDLLKRFQKFDDTFQTMQNPHFQICDGAFVKVLKKLKTHNYGMSFEMLNLFVVQRHLLRIKYFNEIGVTNLNGGNNDKKIV